MDGAPWIRLQVEGQNLPLDELGLDFYHLAENVHKARRAVYGETDEAGTAWAGEWLHAFKHDGYDAAWEKLVAWRSGWRSPKRAAADGLMNSVCERRTTILYPVGFDDSRPTVRRISKLQHLASPNSSHISSPIQFCRPLRRFDRHI